MTIVGVREFKRDLSGYLKRAAAGEAIRVTVRGASPVDLVPAPVEATAAEARYEAEFTRLVAAGKMTRATAPKTKITVWDFDLDESPLKRILDEREADVWPRRPYPEDELA